MELRESPLGADEINRLAQGLEGWVIRPGDEAYEEARRVFNGMTDRRPGVIARVSGTDDARHMSYVFAMSSGTRAGKRSAP
jgi:hypothetical protein